VSRAGALLRVLRHVVQQQPGLLDASVVEQVEGLAAADDINPAVKVRVVKSGGGGGVITFFTWLNFSTLQ